MRDSSAPVRETVEHHLVSDGFRAAIPALRQSYQQDDFAEIPAFMPGEIFRGTLQELQDLFDGQSRRRDTNIEQSGRTPRRFTTLARDIIASGSSIIPAVFESSALRAALEEIVDEKVLPVPYEPEQYIATRLHEPGDVHGWHWDDYTWALVWIFKMPDEDNGGSLEYVKDVPWDPTNPRVGEFVAAGPVTRRHPSVGSAYLLKAGTALHRVSPLSRAAERMMVCFSFASVADLEGKHGHESIQALF
ncbi:HalD/BesD family halogenase [Streptomyces lasiicapitis]|uniref:HalD/BesD family halogenase n=1 Tax=Streptomyces lasiicapitis TaxID=1923961 RepID=UPI00364E7745